ncbi:MAG: glycosyltransferase family 4 protein [Leptolyngbya sp. BL-A-14]
MFLPIASVVAAAATLGLTPLVQKMGLQWGYVDQPGKRKVHQQPIVRVGGIAIFAGTMLTLLVAFFSNSFHVLSTPAQWQIIGILLGGAGFFLIGLLDDVLNLSPFIRLFLQGVVACLCWSLGVRVEALPIPFVGAFPTGVLSLPITFFWLAGVANAINWIDGLDGLAGGVSAIAAIAFGILCWDNPPLALIALSLAGSLIGFLRYNVNPARIFMGDGGSYFIGFTLAAIGAVGMMHSSTFTETSLPFWILAVPIADMVRVIASRLWERKSPFFADQRHLHHKLLKANFSVKGAVTFVWCLTGWFGVWAAINAAIPYSTIALLISSILLVMSSLPLWSPLLPTPARSR